MRIRTLPLTRLAWPALLALLPVPSLAIDQYVIDAAAGPVQEKAACRGARSGFCALRIYQVMVEAFVDGDPDHDYGDGYGTSHHRGDLRGIIESLDYIAELGMNAIWLTPVFDSQAGAPQQRLDGGSAIDLKLDATGYYTRNYFAIDPRFGTLDDARELVDQAHQRGLYVLFDGVFGHHKGGLVPSPTGQLPVDSEDPADYGGDPGSYPGRVVDFDAPESTAFYREVASWWIREVGIDGWRLDQAYQVPLSAWAAIGDAVEQASASRPGNPGYLVAEIFADAAAIRDQAFGPTVPSVLPSAFDFPVRYALVGVLAGEESGLSRRPASVLAEPWAYGAHSATYPGDALPNLMVGNHDLVRFGDLLQRAAIANPGDPAYWARHRLAFMLQAAYSGPITRYYGEEIGDEVPGFSARVEIQCADRGLCDDHVARSSGRVPGVTIDENDLEPEAAALRNFHRHLMAARARLPALSHGRRQHLFSDARLYVDLKTYAEQKVVFLMNTGDDALDVELAGAEFNGQGAPAWDVMAESRLALTAGRLVVRLEPLSARLVLLSPEAPAVLSINAGLNDAWMNPAQPGQGVFITVFPDLKKLFLAWFTYDAARPGPDTAAVIGEPGHRWLTALGPYAGNLAELSVEITRGGVFDATVPQPTQLGGGQLRLEFPGCNRMILNYELQPPGLEGRSEMTRVVGDNLALCRQLGGLE